MLSPKKIFLGYFKKLSFVFVLVAVGVLLPQLFGGQIESVKATTFSASTKVSETASGGSNTLKIQKFNGIYYLTQTVPNGANTGQLQIATSTDGTTWSAFSTIINPTSPRDYAFGYYENGGFYYAIFSNYDYNDYATDAIYITTSSDAITWSPTTTVAIAAVPGPGYIFASTVSSSSYISVVYADSNTAQIYLATSTNGVSWSATAIRSRSDKPELVNFVAGDDNNLHLLFNVPSDLNATTTTQVFLEYAKSANGGATWSTTTLGRVDYDYYYSTANNALTLDSSGNPGVFYYKIDALSGCAWDDVEEWYVGDCAVTTSVHYAKYSGSSWSSSTVATFSLTVPSTSSNGIDNFSSLSFAPNGEAVMAGIGTNFYPYLIVNTNTLDISQVEITQIDNKALYDLSPWGNGITMVFNTSTLTAGVAFIGDDGSGTDRDVWFTTSSVLVAPSAPTGLTATPSTTTQIDLSWNSADGATSYILYRDTNSGFTATTTVTTTALTSYSDTGLTASTQYYYKVAAVNTIGTSVPSASVNTTTLAEAGSAPTAPSGATLSSIATSSMVLSWVDASSDEDGFVIDYTNDDASWVLGNTVAANATSTSFSSMAPNKFFRFRVAAYNTFGTSTFSTTTGEYTDPVVPGTPAFSSVSTSSLTVSWADNSNASGTLYYLNYTGGFVTTTNTSTSLTGLTPNTEYSFAVRTQYLSSSTLYTSYSASSTTSTSALANNAPTVTAIYPIQATNGTGLVTVTTTITDADGDTVSLSVDYSLDGGTTWASTTLDTVTGDGTPATSTGSITNITSTADGNALTFTWNTQADNVTVTTTAQIRITPNDGTANGSSQTSANFTVDNEAPAIPSITSFIPSTSTTISVNWGVISGAATYAVSSTAGSLVVTANTSTSYTGLTPNTSYSFQIKAIDAYGNKDGYSTVSSTYTNAANPVIPVISAVSTSTATLTWGDNSNPVITDYYVTGNNGFTPVTVENATTTPLTGLTSNTSYTFSVQSINADLTLNSTVSADATTTLAVNTAPTVTAISPAQATDGTGLVTVTTTVSDADADVTSITVQYLSGDGVTWASSTISSVSGTGTFTTSSGQISGITTTVANALTFTWDSLTDLGAITTSTQIKITPNDGTVNGTAVTSTLTVDNEVPSAPTTITLTPATSSIAVSWSDVSGASTYTVSTTAGTATTTASSVTTTAYSGLTPNTGYSFQVKVTDAYGNVGSFSTASSTYTLASTPTAPTVTAASSTILNITVANDSATTYAVKIVTGVTTKYLQADGTIGDSAVWMTYAQLGGGSATSTTGLSVNTSYTVSVAGKNGDGTATGYTAADAVYTLANQASTPTIGTATTSTLPITINVNSNPAATTYAIYNYTDSNYLTSAGVATTTAVYQTTSTWDAISAIGLTPNTSYQFQIIARNGGNVNAATSTANALTYTNPNIPATVSASANGQTSMIVSWSANSNSAGTLYQVYNYTDSEAEGTTTSTSYTVTGLTASTSYRFNVRAQYQSDDETYTDYSATSTAVSTAAVASTVSMTLSTGASSTFQLSAGGTAHTATLNSIASGVASVTIASTPVTVSLSQGQSENIDTNDNGADDMTVTMTIVGASSAAFSLASYTPPATPSGGGSPDTTPPVNVSLAIYGNKLSTTSTSIKLVLGASGASSMMIANTANFSGGVWETYATSKQWTLTTGSGQKIIYAKFKDYSNNVSVVVFTTITLAVPGEEQKTETDQQTEAEQGMAISCALEQYSAYKLLASPAVYYITSDCTKRPFSRSNVFFTYFASWNDVKITAADKLNSISDDTLGFMPYGPLYDPKYGALVKIVTDPKVYLLLGTEKYWITSESIFNFLNYSWNWIEDIDQRLLNKYTIGSEITYTDHHPNYTLIKYPGSNKVYRLEPDPQDSTRQIKRWIPNENIFNTLNFRWDRIVTVGEAEKYEEGDNLGAEAKTVGAKYVFTSFLSLGSVGEEVKQLQIKLQELGYLDKNITPNGSFGQATREAVIKLQTEHQLLPAEGYVGPGTRGVLNQ